ncbi:MAG: hypothetical protein ACE5NG_13535 [bacterium]
MKIKTYKAWHQGINGCEGHYSLTDIIYRCPGAVICRKFSMISTGCVPNRLKHGERYLNPDLVNLPGLMPAVFGEKGVALS